MKFRTEPKPLSYVTLTVANLSLSEEAECNIEFLGAEAAEIAKITTLSAENVRDHNTFDKPDAVTPEVSIADGSFITIPRAGIISVEYKIK